MDPLPRIRWLLRHRPDTEAPAPLLDVLAAAAASGPRAAEAVACCQGMTDAIAAVLGPQYCGGGSGAGNGGGAGTGGGTDGGRGTGSDRDVSGGRSSSSDEGWSGGGGGAGAALRVAALRLVRLMVQASPLAAQMLGAAGLLTAAQAALLRRPPGAGAGEGDEEGVVDGLMRLEAMRVWRVTATQVRAGGRKGR